MRPTDRLRAWARTLKRESLTLWFAARDPRTPRAAKALCAFVVAYALSPIDLIPDFIPVLGLLDDAILLPGLIWLALRLVPDEVLAACRAKADDWMAQRGARPLSIVGAAFIVALWLGSAAMVVWFVMKG